MGRQAAYCSVTRAAIEVHRLFSEIPQVWSSRAKLLPDEKSHGPDTHRESCHIIDAFSTILGEGAPSFTNRFRRKVIPLS